MPRFFSLEFDHWMISGVHVLGLTRFTKIKIGARATLEAIAGNGRLLTPIARDAMVDNLRIDGLSKLEQRVLCWMHG
jgi:glycerol kinase